MRFSDSSWGTIINQLGNRSLLIFNSLIDLTVLVVFVLIQPVPQQEFLHQASELKTAGAVSVTGGLTLGGLASQCLPVGLTGVHRTYLAAEDPQQGF